MHARCFLHTNILVYAFEPSSPTKQMRARELIATDRSWAVSWQVVQEFVHVARHPFRKPLETEYLAELIDLLLAPRCAVFPCATIWRSALAIQTETQYSFYDSLILASAIESGAPTLYSEDLQHGRRIGPLEIINPFL